MKINYEKHLNEEQLKVVKNGDGYALVLSGPGSGKTRTIVARNLHILINKKASPNEMVSITFTKKAANEL